MEPNKSSLFASQYSLNDFIEFFEYDCDLTDNNFLCQLARVVLEYAPYDIRLEVGLKQTHYNPATVFRYSACMAANGNMYLFIYHPQPMSVIQVNPACRKSKAIARANSKSCGVDSYTQFAVDGPRTEPLFYTVNRGQIQWRERTREKKLSSPHEVTHDVSAGSLIGMWQQTGVFGILALRGPTKFNQADECSFYQITTDIEPGRGLPSCYRIGTFSGRVIEQNCSYFIPDHNTLLIGYNQLRAEAILNDENQVPDFRDAFFFTPQTPYDSLENTDVRFSLIQFDGNGSGDRVHSSTEIHLQVPDSASQLFEQAQCYFMFYHRVSDTYVVLVKLADSSVLEDFFSFEEPIDENDDRILVRFRIDLATKRIVSLYVGLVVIPEHHCEILAYDEFHSVVILDTMVRPTEAIAHNTTKRRSSSKRVSESTSRSSIDISSDGTTPSSEDYDFDCNETFFVNRYKIGLEFRVIRLNDLVSRWRKIFDFTL